MSVLFFHTMKYRPEDPRNANNDRFILSKVKPTHTINHAYVGAKAPSEFDAHTHTSKLSFILYYPHLM